MWRQEQGIDWSARWAARVPEPVRAWLTRGLAFEPADRFASTTEMRDAWSAAWKSALAEEQETAAEETRGKDARGAFRSFLKAGKRLLPSLTF